MLIASGALNLRSNRARARPAPPFPRRSPRRSREFPTKTWGAPTPVPDPHHHAAASCSSSPAQTPKGPSHCAQAAGSGLTPGLVGQGSSRRLTLHTPKASALSRFHSKMGTGLGAQGEPVPLGAPRVLPVPSDTGPLTPSPQGLTARVRGQGRTRAGPRASSSPFPPLPCCSARGQSLPPSYRADVRGWQWREGCRSTSPHK